MNFFGHAVVAYWHVKSTDFVLGSMLPDFATMIRARPPRVEHEGLASGIAFHHDTDRVFHRTAAFVELTRDALRDLRERGLRRGSALAVAHVGVEILLDAALASDEAAARAYVDALSMGSARALGGEIHWGDSATFGRYDRLRALLAERGVHASSADAETVAFRLGRALAGRPRLELDAAGLDIVREWAGAAASDVAAKAAPLLAELRAGLAATRPAGT